MKSDTYSYKRYRLILIILQTLTIVFVFWRFFSEPHQWMFQNVYDGLKNYYTLVSYILQDETQGYLDYSFMNYPFGDFIFYTDNTPIFAVALRWINLNLTDISGSIIPIFNFFLLGNLLITSLITFDIGRLLNMRPAIALIMALAITWTCPMMLRLFGHFNLSLMMFIAASIWLMIRWDEMQKALTLKNALVMSLGLGLLIFVASMSHLYYLPILCLFCGVYLLAKTIDQLRLRKPMHSYGIILLFGVIIPAIVVWLTIRMGDNYYLIRSKNALGYGGGYWKLSPDDLLKAYPFSTLPGLGTGNWKTFERFAFVGHFSLVIVLISMIRFLSRRSFNWTQGSVKIHRSISFLIIAGIILLFTSFGDMVHMFNGRLVFDNWLSPLYYVSGIFPEISNFRCLARFVWPFFFVINIWAFTKWDSWLKGSTSSLFRWLVVLTALIPLGFNAADMGRLMYSDRYSNEFRNIPDFPRAQ